MFIFKAGPRKVFRLKPVRCAKKVADPCSKPFLNINYPANLQENTGGVKLGQPPQMSGVTFFGVRIQSGSIDLNSNSNPTPRIFSKP